MQPIVAQCQQPMVGPLSRKIQLMVVRTKDEARKEFARNLNSELDEMRAPKRGRPAWLRKRLENLVSYESCRKWLAGKDLPDQAHFSVLISRLGINEQKLRTGRWSPPPRAGDDERLDRLTKAWPDLSLKTQGAIMSLLDMAEEVRQLQERPSERIVSQRKRSNA